MSYIKTIIKSFNAIALGMCVALYLLQFNGTIYSVVQQRLQEYLSSAFDCSFSCQVSEINFFTPHLVLDNLSVVPRSGARTWSWRSKRAVVTAPWWKIITKRIGELDITLYGYTAFSEMDLGSLAILPHYQKIFGAEGIDVPVFLKRLSIPNGTFECAELRTGITLNTSVHSTFASVGDFMKVTIYPTGGTITRLGTTYAHTLLGSIRYIGELEPKIDCSLTVELPQLQGEQRCFVVGSYAHNDLEFRVYTSDRDLLIEPLSIDRHGHYMCRAKLPWSYVSSVVFDQSVGDGAGSCVLQLQGSMSDPLHTAHGMCSLSDVLMGFVPITKAWCSISACEQSWKGMIECSCTGNNEIIGSWELSQEGNGLVSLTNKTVLGLPSLFHYRIQPRDLMVQLSCNTQGDGELVGIGHITDAVLDTVSSATIQGKKNGREVAGEVEWLDRHLAVRASVTDTVHIKHASYAEGNKLLALLSSDDTSCRLSGDVDYALLRSCVPRLVRDDVVGEGRFHVEIEPYDTVISGSVTLQDGMIKVPRMYNVVDGFSMNFQFDPVHRSAKINDLVCSLHRGNVAISSARVLFDTSYTPTFFHVPLSFDQCFVSWQRDLFAVTSGHLMIRDHPISSMEIDGTIVLDRSQSKGNIMSGDMSYSFFMSPGSALGFNPFMNVFIETRHPLIVGTSLWDAEAMMRVSLHGPLEKLAVLGTIELLSGKIKFPYKPLTVTHGRLELVPYRLENPGIELTAKGRIKKYAVTMRVVGTLEDPHIMFESSPALTEEQIIALLLAGSEESSLSILMPALIMQNLQYILFGPAQSQEKLEEYFRGLLKPLSYVRFIPKFSDQSGRGGLKGIIEVDVSDHLTGRIEQGFSLSEDTRFEVDYQLSDDISLRGIKDERGNLGGEVEMKWKF
ncbi:translocation/assembly module TamB domain-containing protein [Candidatus Babeliales bacterium]|nr:translocation/assembly module TamB domain-containing protein [Candidatus Babeliales bacterium]